MSCNGIKDAENNENLEFSSKLTKITQNVIKNIGEIMAFM